MLSSTFDYLLMTVVSRKEHVLLLNL